jgi:hypothetical protein
VQLRLLIALAALFVASPARAGDPELRYWTVTTPHFRVHYHDGLGELAQRVAGLAERAHSVLVPELATAPSQVTQIVLSDSSDDANGLAIARPYNAILLLANAPPDMSALGGYDDWYDLLVVHEYTHVVHIDSTTGLPGLINAIFGKLYTPNDWQPRFILEGLGVAMESEHTDGGRLGSSQYEMYLRADVLDGRVVPLDQLSNTPRRWPGSNLAYVYGSRFLAWISDVYGPGTFAAVTADYSDDVIPFGINRSLRRVTGRTYPELYRAFVADLERDVRKTARAIELRGLRQGVRLTRRGQQAASPRFLPPRCAPEGVASVVYARDDGHDPAGLYRVPVAPGSDGGYELLTRATSRGLSVAPDCAIVFDSVAPSRRRHLLSDLFELEPFERAPEGVEGARRRLSVGRRARSPDVSPDGSRIAYVTSRAGTTTVRIADRTKDGRIANERVLVPSVRYEQAFTPRFSPDGKRLAYGVWRTGGYRNLRVVELASGAFIELFEDRAIDQQPSWSADGKTLYFTSDRSGVANVYAYELETGTLRQVTNVLTGAYYPEVSADGRTLIYVGYDSQGFDLYSMPLEPSRFLEPAPAPLPRAGRASVAPRRYPVRPYSALPTLRPYSLGLSYGTGTFGNALTIQTTGSDALNRHAFTASITLESEGEWQGLFDYSFSRLPFTLHETLYRSVSPRSNYRVGETRETVTEQLVALGSGIDFPLPGEFSSESLGLSYTVASFSHEAPFGTRGDPWAPVPVEPSSGVVATVHAGYRFSNASGSSYGISAERGLTLTLGVDFADPAIGSESTLRAVQGSLTGYLEAPWSDHHVLALAASGGSSGGTYPRRGLYSTGGFADQPVLDAYTSGLFQSAFVLRGYEPGRFVGSEYALFNAEYRFPLLDLQRGISTLPIFLDRVSATVFADYGGAYFAVDPDDPLDVLHFGTGAELWISLTLGYHYGATLRLGAARGFGEAASEGDGSARRMSAIQTYFVAASGF